MILQRDALVDPDPPTAWPTPPGLQNLTWPRYS